MHGLLASMIGCGLAFACAAGTNENVVPGNSPKAPRIVFDSTERDLGTLTNAEFVTAAFTFQNTGNADLHIKVLEMGGYSGPPPTFPPVPPGQKGTVAIKLNIGRTKGRLTKHLKYGTNDPMNPVVPLTVTVNID
jgi:hypothetical protein